jgi:hypothetical protein
MDVDRMLEKCKRDQWRPEDLDWSSPPKPMTRAQEEAIVQYFVNMSAIERFAKALFEEQRNRVEDAKLKKIYATFVADEERHAVVAERLARYYDLHAYKTYEVSKEIERFKPHFLRAIKYLSDEVANAYITGGELMLDVALLRSLDDYVDDDMSHRAMELINRDESRHIAVDYHMVEYYTTDAYWEKKKSEPAKPMGHRLLAAWSFVSLLRTGGPFFMEMFFRPMQTVDPSGKRLTEAFKRMQLLQAMPGLDRSPLARFSLFLRDTYNHPFYGKLFGGIAQRIAGVPHSFMKNLYSREEAATARKNGFGWLASEALNAKLVT